MLKINPPFRCQDAKNTMPMDNENRSCTTAERCATAVRTTDLGMHLEHGCAADVITAMGWAARKNPLGVALLRAQHEGESLEVQIALQEAVSVAWKLCQAGEHSADAAWWIRFARAAVAHWQSPACPHCHGRRFDVIQGTPALSATPCRACKGSGARKPPRIGAMRMDRDTGAVLWAEVQDHLATRQSIAERRIRRSLTSRH